MGLFVERQWGLRGADWAEAAGGAGNMLLVCEIQSAGATYSPSVWGQRPSGRPQDASPGDTHSGAVVQVVKR